MNRLDEWMVEYEKNLKAVVSADKEKPREQQQYHFGVALVPTVAQKMRVAFIEGSYNKDGDAIKRTCKAFRIKQTYSAISGFISAKPEAAIAE